MGQIANYHGNELRGYFTRGGEWGIHTAIVLLLESPTGD